jgi:tRNA G18 (ribose-2'-O)-methylase SpoU
MTAASDNPSSGGDFDLSGFKSKPRKKSSEEGAASAPRTPRDYGESTPRPPVGPKREGKLPSSFKSKEHGARPDAPRTPRKPYEAGDAPRKKFASDFRPKEGDRPAPRYGAGAGGSGPRKPYGADRGDRPSRPYGAGAGGAGPRKPYGDRSADSERPSRSFGGGDRPSRPYGSDRPSRPYGAGGGGDRPARPYGAGAGGDRPARPYGAGAGAGGAGPRKPYGSDRPSRPYGAGAGGDRPARPYGAGAGSSGPRKPYGSDRGGDRPARPYGGSGGGYPGSRDATTRSAPAFVSELSPDIKKFLPLLTEKGRHKESRFIIEGAKNVADVAENSPDIIHTVLIADGFDNAELKARLDELRVRTRIVAESDLSALCGTEAPQGIVAIANFGSLRPDWATINSVTLLDGVQDPGNLGAILRTSAALGMDAVVLGKGTCDPYNPKVVRASAAALLRMPLETGEDLAMKIHFLRSKGFTIVATSPHAKISLDQAKLRRKVALLFGSEGGGVGANLIDQADIAVRIPMKGMVESLNVAVAHGLLAYDLMRMKR